MDPIYVLDAEWKHDGKKVMPKEIGIAMVILDESGTYLAVKPPRYLIKIDEDHHSLFDASQFLKAMGIDKARLWASYGFFDNVQLRKVFEAEGEVPLALNYLDIQTMYLTLEGETAAVNLKEAAFAMTGHYLGAQHHADDDAYNAGRVLAAILNKYHKEEK